MRYALSVLSLFVLGAGIATLSADDASGKEKGKKFQATCPVSGKPAAKDHGIDFRGKKVYFCCPNCPEAFKANPKKYRFGVKTQFLETDQLTQVACPVTGRPVGDTKTVALATTEVKFCCPRCVAKAKSSGNLAKLAFGNFDKGFTLQTACPVSGKPIHTEHVVEYKGRNVYFCCPNCPATFKANPEKFKSKLPQFTYFKKKQ